MTDEFADQFKRYWAVIVTVASIMGGSSVALFTVQMQTNSRIAELSAGQRELRAIFSGAMENITEFKNRTESSRYTSSDAARDRQLFDAEHKRIWDSIEQLRKE